jgi:cysteine sulfinate desulfinase/cysteine desulfurase-like protein
VLLALGVDTAAANSLVRFSLGRDSTAGEVAHVERVLPAVIARAQRAA